METFMEREQGDVVERLHAAWQRAHSLTNRYTVAPKLVMEAANEIERLRALLGRVIAEVPGFAGRNDPLYQEILAAKRGADQPAAVPCVRCGGTKTVRVIYSQHDEEWTNCPHCTPDQQSAFVPTCRGCDFDEGPVCKAFVDDEGRLFCAECGHVRACHK
jgi:hypothetical protein